MDQQPIDPGIEKLLQDLSSRDTRLRRNAAQTIRGQKITDGRIIEALTNNAARDENNKSRKEAIQTLKELGIEPPPLDPELVKKRRDFWIGFGMFFGLNILLWGFSTAMIALFSAIDSSGNLAGIGGLLASSLPFLINIGLIVFLAFKRPSMAFGMLVAFGVSLLIVLCLALIFGAVCFIALASYSGG